MCFSRGTSASAPLCTPHPSEQVGALRVLTNRAPNAADRWGPARARWASFDGASKRSSSANERNARCVSCERSRSKPRYMALSAWRPRFVDPHCEISRYHTEFLMAEARKERPGDRGTAAGPSSVRSSHALVARTRRTSCLPRRCLAVSSAPTRRSRMTT